MKITIDNYKDIAEGVDESSLPEALQFTHDTLKMGTRNFKSWNRYETDKDFREVTDLHFEAMERYLGHKKPKKTANKTLNARKSRASVGKAVAKSNRSNTAARKSAGATEKAKTRKVADARAEKPKKTRKVSKKEPKEPQTRTVRTTLGRAVLDALRGDAATAPRRGQKRSFQNNVATKRKANVRRIKRTLGDRQLVSVSATKSDLKGKTFIREVDKLANQIHAKSITDQSVTYPVYRISRHEAKRQAFKTLKTVKSGKVKNVKLKV